MTKTEIKIEIQKVLDNVPENVLQDILDLLKGLQNQPLDKLEITHSLREIIAEDKELLEKPAQWSTYKLLKVFTIFLLANLEVVKVFVTLVL